MKGGLPVVVLVLWPNSGDEEASSSLVAVEMDGIQEAWVLLSKDPEYNKLDSRQSGTVGPVMGVSSFSRDGDVEEEEVDVDSHADRDAWAI